MCIPSIYKPHKPPWNWILLFFSLFGLKFIHLCCIHLLIVFFIENKINLTYIKHATLSFIKYWTRKLAHKIELSQITLLNNIMFTVFPQIVSVETIFFEYVQVTVYESEETIQGRKLFKGGNYSWKYRILNFEFPYFEVVSYPSDTAKFICQR